MIARPGIVAMIAWDVGLRKLSANLQFIRRTGYDGEVSSVTSQRLYRIVRRQLTLGIKEHEL